MSKIISKKYARALLEVAQEKEKLAEVIVEVDELRALMQVSKLSDFFSKKIYSAEEKSQLVQTLKSASSDLMTSFLQTIESNGRLPELEAILLEFKYAADDLMKISDVEVTTAVPITTSQEEKMINMIKEKFAVSDIRLSKKLDEKILGGFIIKNRGEIIDASIKGQLAKIATEIL